MSSIALCGTRRGCKIFESVGMRLANVFDEQGAPCAPIDAQQEIYVEARA